MNLAARREAQSQLKAERNRAIFESWCSGFSIAKLAREHGLTQQRASQIISQALAEMDPAKAEELRLKHPTQAYGYRGKRRRIDQSEAVRLWKMGFSAREVAAKLSEKEKTPFHPGSVVMVIKRARESGVFIPHRRSDYVQR